MLTLLNRFLFAGLLIAGSPIHGFASPVQSKLLTLIPRDAQVVAGVEDPGNPDTRGHLLLVTVKSPFDFDDCLSLTGVDTHRGVDETIWIAASSPQGKLNEHMLLVTGRFDREHIFQAAEQNGATTSIYRGLEVLLVKPFAREERQMHDTRWMAILDGRTVVFGTPWLVQKALDRYVSHEPADPLVADRLGRLHPHVNSWSVLVMAHGMSLKHAALEQSSAPWIDLLGKDLLEGADELTLGIRYGSTSRVDFVIRKATIAKRQVVRLVPTGERDGNGSKQVHCRGCGLDLRTLASSRILFRGRSCCLENNWMRASHLFRAAGRLRHFERKDETCDRQGPNRANMNRSKNQYRGGEPAA
jgi:hypothetical protein